MSQHFFGRTNVKLTRANDIWTKPKNANGTGSESQAGLYFGNGRHPARVARVELEITDSASDIKIETLGFAKDEHFRYIKEIQSLQHLHCGVALTAVISSRSPENDPHETPQEQIVIAYIRTIKLATRIPHTIAAKRPWKQPRADQVQQACHAAAE